MITQYWIGPVTEEAANKSTIPGAKLVLVYCSSIDCPQIGDKLATAGPSKTDDVFLCAFSAGGSVVKRALEKEDYRKVTKGVVLGDASYTSSWEDAENHKPPVIEGFLLYALDVLESSDKIFIATASLNKNGEWASGIDNLERLRQEIEKRTGKKFEKQADFFGIVNIQGKKPETVWKLGNIYLVEFTGSSHMAHWGHMTIQPDVIKKAVVPWLQKESSAPDSIPKKKAGLIVGAVLLGLGIYWWLSS